MTTERKICTFENCGKKQQAKGYCPTHYAQMRRTGRVWKSTKGTNQWGKWTTDGHGKYLRRWRINPTTGKREHIYQHVDVMQRHLGRKLLPGENVHHINGVRDDNRIENLELWVSKQPKGQRPEDLVAWAEEILGRYAPEKLV